MTFINKNKEKADVTSVLIPLYNHESTVEKSLNSLLLSDCSKIELIICDDASIDKSFEIVALWIEKFKWRFESVLLIKNLINHGITKNINKLNEMANGEFVTYFASDDELSYESIDLQKKFLKKNTTLDFVYSNCSYIDSKSNTIVSKVVADRRAKFLKIKFFLFFDMVFNWEIIWARVFGRRVAFVNIAPYPERFSFEDRWGALKIAATERCGYLHKIVYRYRVRNVGNATAGIDVAVLKKEFIEMERLLMHDVSGYLKIWLFIKVNAYDVFGVSKIRRFIWLSILKALTLIYKILLLKK
jgi:glycosyltransferase involved in cell wall biosynthesis